MCPAFKVFGMKELLSQVLKKKKIRKKHFAGQNISRTLQISFDALSSEQIPGVGGFYGTGIEICAGFGPVVITKKTV